MIEKFLYYPNIIIPNESWVKSSLLYWDQMQFICPNEYLKKIESSHVKDLMDAGLVTNANPMDYLEDLHKFEDAFLDLLLTIYSTDGLNFFKTSNKRTFLIHKNKMQYSLFKKLEAFGGAADQSQDWYIVREDLGSLYMMVLAYVIAEKNEGMNLVTHNEPVVSILHKISKKIPAEDELKREANNSFYKNFESSIANLLPVPETMSGKELLKLKEVHGASLQKLKKNVNERYQKVLHTAGMFKYYDDRLPDSHKYLEILNHEFQNLFKELEKEVSDLEDNLKSTSNLSWTRAGISLIPTIASAAVNTNPDIAAQAIAILVVGMANLASYAGREISQAVGTRSKLLGKSNLEFSFFMRNNYSKGK